MNIKLKQGS